METVSYNVHDNGGRPFKVAINSDTVSVYAKRLRDGVDHDGYYNAPSLTIEAESIFIGKSSKNEMTSSGQGYGPKFDGNSILVKTHSPLQYVFIGLCIYKFTAKSEIVRFDSNVSSNDCPCPEAYDEDGNVYLLWVTKNKNIMLAQWYKDINQNPSSFYIANKCSIPGCEQNASLEMICKRFSKAFSVSEI
jgi:hypothetical protein